MSPVTTASTPEPSVKPVSDVTLRLLLLGELNELDDGEIEIGVRILELAP